MSSLIDYIRCPKCLHVKIYLPTDFRYYESDGPLTCEHCGAKFKACDTCDSTGTIEMEGTDDIPFNTDCPDCNGDGLIEIPSQHHQRPDPRENDPD